MTYLVHPSSVIRMLMKQLDRQGFTYRVTRRQHLVVYDQAGAWVTTFAGSPSDHRSHANGLARLRRRGFTT